MKHNTFLKNTKVYLKLRMICTVVLMGTLYSQGSTSVEELETEKYSLEREVKKLSQKIEETESIREIEKKRYTTLVERYQKSFAEKETELKDLSNQLKQLQVEIGKENAMQSSIRIADENINAQRKEWHELLFEKCKDLENLISNSLPWEQEQRLDRIRVLKRDLSNQAASVEEGFSRLLSLYRDEIKFGDEIVVHARPIQRLDGSLVNGTLLRLGNQGMMYVDDEEQKYGLLERVEGVGSERYRWKEKLSFEEREQVRQAIAVKLSKKAPQIVTIPFSLVLSRTNVSAEPNSNSMLSKGGE